MSDSFNSLVVSLAQSLVYYGGGQGQNTLLSGSQKKGGGGSIPVESNVLSPFLTFYFRLNEY